MDYKMITKIKKHLLDIENEHDCKVLFAIENGSRAWRMNSQNSDYDVRFVFYRPITEYIKVNKSQDVIERVDKSNNIEYVGFDIIKFMQLLMKGNPTTVEWLLSDIVYIESSLRLEWRDNIKTFYKSYGRFQKNLCAGYKGMAKSNYIKYMNRAGSHPTLKNYLYCLRGIINSRVVALGYDLPIEFEQAITLTDYPDKIKQSTLDILKKKKKCLENDNFNRNVEIEEFIETETNKSEDIITDDPVPDSFFNEAISKVM